MGGPLIRHAGRISPHGCARMDHDNLSRQLHPRHPQYREDDRDGRRLGQRRSRPSYFAFKYLLERGYRMIPVNPGLSRARAARAEGLRHGSPTSPSRSTWSTSSAPRNTRVGIVEEALALKPRPQVIWMQLGIRNDEAARARRGERPQGGDEPLPQDRIRPAVVGDRLDGRQYPHHHRQEGAAFRPRHPASVAQPGHDRGRHDRCVDRARKRTTRPPAEHATNTRLLDCGRHAMASWRTRNGAASVTLSGSRGVHAQVGSGLSSRRPRGLPPGCRSRSRSTSGQRQAACQDDAFRFCQATIPDRERTLACLISNKDGISGACRAVLAELIPPDKPAKKQAPRKKPKGGPIDLTPTATR